LTNETIVIFAVGTALLILCAVVAILASRKKVVYKKKGQLLLLNEQRFLTALLHALPSDTMVTMKVRLLDIVSMQDAASGKNMDDELADHCVDFVLLDRTNSSVRLCIEMDAESQSAAERLQRNTLISRALRRAGVPHLRLPLVRFYDPIRLRQVIRSALDGSIGMT
jgi:hypothetical protein